MFLQRLFLHNFRIYPEARFDFSPRINTIVGDNARGKTSLLEAIYLLMTGRSFRTHQLTDLIRQGTTFFTVEGIFIKHGIEQKLRISYSATDKLMIHNHTAYQSFSSLLGLLQGVILTSDDIALVRGAPILRRHFLDLQLAQADPLYVHYHSRYYHAMKQRNCLLRKKNIVTIESWEQEMANAATYIRLRREAAIEELQQSGRQLYTFLSNEQQQLSFTYKSDSIKVKQKDSLLHYYKASYHKMRSRELTLGFTLLGPHKDDLGISIGNKDVRFFASEGQQRSCVAALRLAEWKHLSSLSGEPCLMLIDDVGISLDDSRRNRLFQYLGNLDQVFLSTTQNLSINEQQLINI